ncbi:hypothetical protein AAMO2058_001729100 [Amorphochlora amoebiformis]|uniref:CRAL-TRIO domain-containing protein n=1 Tax=Amorphochlora amoebiformis TaxID=1561963 RepID=A0A7S0H7D0_9EUKA
MSEATSAYGPSAYLQENATKMQIETLKTEEKKAIVDLNDAATKAGYQDVPKAFLLRFLENSNFDPTKAFEKLTPFLDWYKDEKIADLTKENEPKENIVMRKCIPHLVYGPDNEGRPVYFELTGKIRCDLLHANITKDNFLKCHAWGMQNMMARGEESSLELKKPVTKFVMVMDLDGMSFAQRSGLQYILSVIAFDDKYYPNFLGKLYIVNLGWVFPMLWQLVKAYLPSYIKDHIELVSGDVKTEMPKYFPKSTLPPMYGGTGPSIDILDTSDLKDAKASTHDGEDLEEENIAAGDKFEICIEAENSAGTFGWYFVSEGDYDVGFSVTVEEKDGKIEPRKFNKIIADKGSYTSKGPCVVRIVWDNSYSLFTSKTIKYYASVAEVGAD